MKRSRFLVVVLAVLAPLLVASTASAAPLWSYTADLTTTAYAISSGDYTGFYQTSAFDDNANTGWASALLGAAVNNAAYIGQDFGGGNAVEVRRFTVAQSLSYPGRRVTSAKLQYSSDTVSWYDAYSTSLPNVSTVQSFDVSPVGAYRYWRLLATSAPLSSGYSWEVMEVEFMGYEDDPTSTPEFTPTPVATYEGGDVYLEVQVDYPTPVPQYFDPTANSGDGPEPWLVRFYVGVFATFTFTYVLFRLVDTHQFYLLFMALCMAVAMATRSVNGAAMVYFFTLVMVLVLKLWAGLQRLLGFGQ